MNTCGRMSRPQEIVVRESVQVSRPRGKLMRCLLLSAWLFALPVAARSLAQPARTADASGFPTPYNSETTDVPFSSPQQALEALQLPPGFTATLFAAEPTVQNPIAACTDYLGRLWVAENYTYAERTQRFDLALRDRVIVLWDSDDDGHADQRQVFIDDVQRLTGIAVGRGGVWLMCPPQLLFLPDRDGDLRPDGPAQVMLDGFTVALENYHNFANGLGWGPDSWLYGRCGASCAGQIGPPGSTPQSRIPLRGGMWRYHPESGAVEVLNQGTTNPWGHDWNAWGELFFINTVNGHFWHAIPGAHFDRPHTLDANPYTYELMAEHADHWHFDTGKGWVASRDGAANDLGGGHAHVGLLLYQEDLWPQEFRDAILTVNMHGRRINHDILRRSGSGYVAGHLPDFALSHDPWFRGMDLIPLPDGNILVLDWSDVGECHEATGVHRTSGRIFKISYGEDAAEGSARHGKPRLSADPSWPQLVAVTLDGPEWHARRARELLRTRFVAGHDCAEVVAPLRARLADPSVAAPTRLRALWALHAVEAIGRPELLQLLSDPAPPLRTWAIRLLTDGARLDTTTGARPANEGEVVAAQVVDRLIDLAHSESEASVRLTLASTLQRLPYAARIPLAAALLRHPDGEDHNIPLMLWYGVLPLGEHAPDDLLALIGQCQWPRTLRLMSRRIAAASHERPELADRLVECALDMEVPRQQAVVEGMAQAMVGWLRAPQPHRWQELSAIVLEKGSETAQQAVRTLSVLFGDGRTIEMLQQLAADGSQPLEARQAAVEALISAGAPGLRDLCLQLLDVRFLNTVALRGLVRENDPTVADMVLQKYRRFHPFDRPQVISALASRPSWARKLLAAVRRGQIEPSEITPFVARQLANLGDEEVLQLLGEVWGQVRPTSRQRRQEMERLKSFLSSGVLQQADLQRGRRLFAQHCGACHRLFGEGNAIGPDLTGAQRGNLDYLIDNIMDPSAVVTKDYRATRLLLDDDRILTGLVTEESERSLTLITQQQTYRLPKESIVQRELTEVSMMPDGLLQPLGDDEVRDLFAYLQLGTPAETASTPTPLP
ncbi:MAG: cytochrome c [Pirellulaceae bacterium]|nr:MAG: cytochrome c [Pirellulaceae bacterium]